MTKRIPDRVQLIDANLKRYAQDAGKRAHDRGLEMRGAVMKKDGDYLVVERRDGSVERLRTLPETTRARAGTVLTRKR